MRCSGGSRNSRRTRDTVARFISLGLTALAVAASAAFAGDSRKPAVAVPAETQRLAQTYLDGHWKAAVQRAPDLYGLAGVDVSHATLAAPFHEYAIREEAARRFALSNDEDPRPYSTGDWYAFPIMVDKARVGSLMIQRNRDENGNKFKAGAGDYFFFGVSFKDSPLDTLLLDLRATHPGAEIEWVQFIGSNAGSRIVIQKANGDVLSAPQGEQPVPIAEDSRRLKDMILKEHASKPGSR